MQHPWMLEHWKARGGGGKAYVGGLEGVLPLCVWCVCVYVLGEGKRKAGD